MADRAHHPNTPELRERWGSFAWTPGNAEEAKKIVARHATPGGEEY